MSFHRHFLAVMVLIPIMALPGFSATLQIPAEKKCQPKKVRQCQQEAELSSQVFAQLRKDAYLDEKDYPEYPELPRHGGRVQATSVSQASGAVTGIWIDDLDLSHILKADQNQDDGFTWFHVWPMTLQKGQTFWLNFHSRRPEWDNKSSFRLRINTDQGIAFDGQVPLDRSLLKITYATQTEDDKTWLVHVQNQGQENLSLSEFYWNNENVSDYVCVGKSELKPMESTLVTLDTCGGLEAGNPWSFAIASLQGLRAVGTGRILKTQFPIEAWNNTSECPLYPDSYYYRRMREAEFDTFYMHPGTCSSCGCDSFFYLDKLSTDGSGWGAIVEDSVLADIPHLSQTKAIRAISTGDESDGKIYDDQDQGVPKPARKALESRDMWQRYPELPTFNGAKTNRNIGSFTGTSDIQGVDLYVAACAPHISSWGNHPPLRGAFDYLRNARLNHMPSPTWLYAQGLSPAWNQKVLGQEKLVQPEPAEILVQGMSAIAAGAKGLLWFQINQKAAEALPQSWEAIASLNRMIAPLRQFLREGDVIGGLEHEEGSIVELIRARDLMVVPIISLRTEKEVNDLKCAAAFVSGSFPHWKFKERGIDFNFEVPSDFGIQEVFEMTPAGLIEPSGTVSVEGRRVIVRDVPVNQSLPVRLMVFARHAGIREQISAAYASTTRP